MEELECEPIIYGRLALGEGTGAAMLFALLDMLPYPIYNMITYLCPVGFFPF